MNKLKFLHKLSIKHKIAAIILSVTSLAIGIGFILIILWNIDKLKSDTQTGLSLNAKLVGSYCVVPLTFDDTHQASITLSSLKNIDNIEAAVLYDSSGKLFATYPEGLSDTEWALHGEQCVNCFRGGYFYIKEVIEFNQEPYGTLFIKANSNPLTKAKQNILIIFSIIPVFILALSFVIALQLQKYISEPIIKLKNHFNTIATNKDFKAKISNVNSDEIGKLYDGFNNLLDEIEKNIQEREKTKLALNESQKKLNLALEGGEIGVWEWDLKSDVTVWDARMEKMFGLDEGTFGQTYEAFKKCLHPNDIDATQMAIEDALAEKTPYDIIHKVVWKNNTIKYIRAKALVLKDKKGVNIKMLGVCFDVTEIKETEEELKKHRNNLEQLVAARTKSLNEKAQKLQESQQAMVYLLEDVNESRDEMKMLNEKIKASNKELEAFAYSVSHDLRAPLRAIDGFTRILMEDYVEKLDDEGKRLGNVIQKNAKKMGKLIDDLLAFSRLGRTSMQFSTIDMKNMANAIYYEATNSSERKRIQLTIADLPDAYGDTNMFRQVWMNLISNAIKFSSKRENAVISISAVQDKDTTTYRISDNGAGFDMRYIDKIFDVFQRLHGEKEYPGTGVGLSLVQRIIHRHNGTIWAESEIEKGATFYFSLPIKKG